MATDYRFLGTNIDVTLVTDAVSGAKQFQIAELRGYDPSDIMGGVDVDIEDYHEADLIQMAVDREIALYRVTKFGEACLVLPGTPAGRFNGRTSSLAVDDVTLAASQVPAYPISIGFTFRMSEEDIAALNGSCPAFHLLSTAQNQQTRLAIDLFPGEGPTGSPGMAVNFFIDSRRVVNFGYEFPAGFADMCMEVSFNLMAASPLDTLASLVVNGEEVETTSFPNLNFDIDDFDFTYGSQQSGTFNEATFQGIMRNLVVTANGVSLVNIADPSAGTNTGSEADGTVTDITSVTVIV